MPRVVKPLSDTQIKNAKVKGKSYTLSDGQGLQLLVKSNGSKLWEIRYNNPSTNKRSKTSLGNYPNLSLENARKKRQEFYNKLYSGINPVEENSKKRKELKTQEVKQQNTFEKVSQEWHKSYQKEVTENYHIKLQKALENYMYPFIKNKLIDELTRKDILVILDDLKNRDLLETAKRTFQILNKVFLFAVTYEYTPHNIMADIDKKIALGKREKKNYPTLTKEKDIKGLLLSNELLK